MTRLDAWSTPVLFSGICNRSLLLDEEHPGRRLASVTRYEQDGGFWVVELYEGEHSTEQVIYQYRSRREWSWEQAQEFAEARLGEGGCLTADTV